MDALDEKELAWQTYLKDGGQQAPPEFTLQDEQFREQLLREGWSDWNKNDFYKFIKMAEKYGRCPSSFALYQEALPHKTPEQIEAYSKAFFQNCALIENHTKYLERISKGE